MKKKEDIIKDKIYTFRLDGSLYQLLQHVREVRHNMYRRVCGLNDDNSERRQVENNLDALDKCSSIIKSLAYEQDE